ncbi:MAG: hypothetical protein AAF221_00525 [Pseudomonadota bacterium]
MTNARFPEGFEALEPFAEWALATTDERTLKRQSASKDELKAFYDAVLPRMEDILDACDAFEFGKLPESHHAIFNIALSMAEIGPHVEFYKADPAVPFSFEEGRFVAIHGKDETWRTLPPNGPR